MRKGIQISLTHNLQRSRKVNTIIPTSVRLVAKSLRVTLLIHDYASGLTSYSGYKKHGWSYTNCVVRLHQFNRKILSLSSLHTTVENHDLTNCSLVLKLNEEHTEYEIKYINKYRMVGSYTRQTGLLEVSVSFNERKLSTYRQTIMLNRQQIIQRLVEIEQNDEFKQPVRPSYNNTVMRAQYWFNIYYKRNKEEARSWFTSRMLALAEQGKIQTNHPDKIYENDSRVSEHLFRNYLSSPFLGYDQIQKHAIKAYKQYKKDVKENREPK